LKVEFDKKLLMKSGHVSSAEKLDASAPSKGVGKGLAVGVSVALEEGSADWVTVETSMTTSVVMGPCCVVVVDDDDDDGDDCDSLLCATCRRRRSLLSSRCSSSDMICQCPSTKTGIRVSINNSAAASVSVSVSVVVGRREWSNEIE
jgi:hypothetical protein